MRIRDPAAEKVGAGPVQGAVDSITTQITASNDNSAAAIATHQTQVLPIVCITFIALSSACCPLPVMW